MKEKKMSKDPRVRVVVEFDIDSESLAEHEVEAKDVLDSVILSESDVIDGFEIHPSHGDIATDFFLCNGRMVSKELVDDSNDDKPFEVVNEDGTPFSPPENPLKEKWAKLYPPIPMPQYSQVCDGYSCIYCGRCPQGDLWKVPEEDREVWKQYQKDLADYDAKHNSSEKDLLAASYIGKMIAEVRNLSANTPNGVIQDADTVLADVMEESDFEMTGIAEGIFRIWEESKDRIAVEQMFYAFTNMCFDDYLKMCIKKQQERMRRKTNEK